MATDSENGDALRSASGRVAWPIRATEFGKTFFALMLLFYGVGGVTAGFLDSCGIAFSLTRSMYSIDDHDGRWLVVHQASITSDRFIAVRVGRGEAPSGLVFPGQFPPAAPGFVVPKFAAAAIEADADVGTIRTVVSAGWPLRFATGTAEEVFQGEIATVTPRSLRSQKGAIVVPTIIDAFPGMVGIIPVAPNLVHLILASAVTSVVVLGARLGVVIGVRSLRERFVLKPGCCVQCRHRFAPGQVRCPECGHQVVAGADPS